MAMTEKDLADWLMADRGQIYVDKSNGNTIGAYQLAEYIRNIVSRWASQSSQQMLSAKPYGIGC